MSVRKERRVNAAGVVREFWFVDIEFRHPDGRRQRIRRVPRTQSRSGAEKKEREILKALEDGTFGQLHASRVPSIEEFAREFLTHARNNNKPSAYAAKEYILRRHIVPFFGKRRLDCVTPRDIEKYKDTTQRGERLHRPGCFSRKSVNCHLTALRTMLRLAATWELIRAETVPRFVLFKIEDSEVEFRDFEEAAQLLAAASDEPLWQAMVVTALNTGLRLGELRALAWGDLKLGRMVVRRNVWRKQVGSPKGKRSREIPLNRTVVDILAPHVREPLSLVFCNEDGSALSEKQCQRAMERLCRRASVKQVQWHALRHTFASHLVMRGVSLKAVQELLGHRDLKETMRYAHLTPDVRREAVDALVGQRQPGGCSLPSSSKSRSKTET